MRHILQDRDGEKRKNNDVKIAKTAVPLPMCICGCYREDV